MIALVEGTVIGTNENSLIIHVNGIGFRVYVTKSFCDHVKINDRVRMHTYLYVREDALNLYGFVDENERDFFVLLLAVNGVGPRAALMLISALSIDHMKSAIINDQADVFACVPGVGKKTAQKIIIHFQGKFDKESELNVINSTVDSEVIAALITLGYSVIEAQSALQAIAKDTPDDIESKLRAVLRYFSE